MFKGALTSLYRNLSRHPGVALLNVLGMSLGFAAFLVIGGFVQQQRLYDSWIPQSGRLYLVSTQLLFPGVGHEVRPESMAGLTDILRADFSDLNVTRLIDQPVMVRRGAENAAEHMTLVDPNFLDVFALEFAAGQRSGALARPDAVLVSEIAARKYFGQIDVLGRTIELTTKAGPRAFVVTGVVKTRPEQSNFRLDFIRALTQQDVPPDGAWKQWGQLGGYTVVKAANPEAVRQLNQNLDGFVDRRTAGYFGDVAASTLIKLRLAPVRDFRLLDANMRKTLAILSAIGVLALAVATVNYVNLATARAGLRAREVAMRKVLGARQGSLRLQFLSETVLLTLVAAAVGSALALVTSVLLNRLAGLDLILTTNWRDGLLLLAFVIGVGLLAGLYPGVVLASFKPARVLTSSRSTSGGRAGLRLREALVVLQFVVVTAFATVVVGFVGQINYLKSQDLGFSGEGLMLVPSTYQDGVTDSQRAAAWAGFRNQPGVVSVAAGDQGPGDDHFTAGAPTFTPGFNKDPSQAPVLYVSFTGPGYFDTYGGKLLAGRWLSADQGADQVSPAGPDPSVVTNVIVSASGARALGLADPARAVGATLRLGAPSGPMLRIVGVVQDLRFRASAGGFARMLFFFDATPRNAPLTVVRYKGVGQSQMRQSLEAAWRQVAPGVPFSAISAGDSLDQAYKPFTDITKMAGFGAAAAAILGGLGLYGLAAFNAARRGREVAVRKVLGAKALDVARLMAMQFLRPVLVATILSWPLSYLALRSLGNLFDGAPPTGIATYLGVSAICVAFAGLVVVSLVLASARSTPARALRYE